MIPSGSECLQPYRLSNFDFVTESFTLIAARRSVPAFSIWYRRCTPVVVSSETPTQRETYFCQRLAFFFSSRATSFRTILNSALSVESGSARSHVEKRVRVCIRRVIRPTHFVLHDGSRPRLRLTRHAAILRKGELGLVALVDEHGHITTVVDDDVRAEALPIVRGPRARVEGALPILLEGLVLPREDSGLACCDGCRGVVLSREDVAAAPSHLGTERLQCRDEIAQVWSVHAHAPLHPASALKHRAPCTLS